MFFTEYKVLHIQIKWQVFLTELCVSLSLSLTPGVRMKIAALSTASTFLT